jgi:hypothetical protein
MNATQLTESAEPTGIGSLQSIRWLLAVGALVLAVSVYRLVASQWSGMLVTAQFLAVVAGSLGVFGAGELLRNRLRLPIVGSALQVLFVVLVPVLSWGASYLDLLGAPGGVVVFAVSIVALLSALRRCLRQALRYDGILYPAAFGLLTLSLPLLSRLSLGSWGYIVTAIGLGGVFHLSSRHINRFLFHRDRRDGIDRPLHALPFIALTVLYVASMSVAHLPASLLALPIAIVGAALMMTGEEYYHALVESARERPKRWPRRSVALLAVGFASLAVSGPLAFLDASGHTVAIVFCALAGLSFRWSFRYERVLAHVLAMGASVVGYFFLPRLMPELAVEKVLSLTDILGLVVPAAKISFGMLGIALFFVWLGRRAVRTASLGRAHAVVATVHLVAIVALSGFGGAKIVAPLAVALAVFAVATLGRREWMVAGHTALGASALAWGGDNGMELLAAVMIALVALSGHERLATWRPWLTWPAFFWASLVAVSGACTVTSGGGVELFAAGVLWLSLGLRLALAAATVAGLATMSLGIHGELAFAHGASPMTLVATTQLLFAASVVLLRRASDSWSLGARASIFGHGALALAWWSLALVSDSIAVTIEPVILALFGWAIVWRALADRDETDGLVGVGFLIAYLPVQLAALNLITSAPVLLLIALAGLLAARALVARFLQPGTDGFLIVWRWAAAVAALGFVGVEAAALALIVVLTGMLLGKTPYRSLLLVLAHGLVWFEGSMGYELFPLAFAHAVASGFSLFAALALVWIVLVEARERALHVWVVALECIVVSVYFMGFVPGVVFSTWDCAVLIAVAAAFAARHARRALRNESADHAWAMQGFVALGVLVAFYAGWITLGNGRAPYVLLAAGVVQHGLASLWRRCSNGEPLGASSAFTGQALALVGGVVAIARLQAWPSFLASAFYLILASQRTKRVGPSILSASFLGLGLVAIASGHGVGIEFYALAPGFSLVALALLLSEEMGPRWSRHVFTAGAAFIYATPVLALYDEITWSWQAVLLLLTVGFGTASFWLRSRPLLTVSTVALVIDLACFIITIRATEPLLLWVAGVFLGVALMMLAAYLEYRRAGLAQQIRVFGRELAGWY